MARLQTRNHESSGNPSGVDPPGGQTRPRAQVGEVALHGTRPRAPCRYPSLMPTAWPRRSTHHGPRWAFDRLLARVRHLSGAPVHLFYFGVSGRTAADGGPAMTVGARD